MRSAPKLAPLITAVGMSFILQNVGLLWLGGSPKSVDDLIHAQQVVFTFVGINVSRADLLAFVVTIPLVIALTMFVTRARLGKAMRATAQDPEAAKLMGINVDTTISLTFLIGGMMAGAAGLTYASTRRRSGSSRLPGRPAGLHRRGHGRHRQPQGRRPRRLIIGCIQQISDNRINPAWTPAIVFAT